MSKLLCLARKCAYTAYTAALFSASQVHLLRETVQHKCSSFSKMVRCISRLKNTFYSRVQCSSVSTSPNFAQEHENEGVSLYEYDEFDHEDFDEWWDEHGELDEETIEEFWDGPVYNQRRSWTTRAVDEAIHDEQSDDWPPGDYGPDYPIEF